MMHVSPHLASPCWSSEAYPSSASEIHINAFRQTCFPIFDVLSLLVGTHGFAALSRPGHWNPHALFTVAYIFLFVKSSTSYGRQPVLSPVSYLFPVTFNTKSTPSWMHSELHCPTVNHPGAENGMNKTTY
jgi:hypothetical protein